MESHAVPIALPPVSAGVSLHRKPAGERPGQAGCPTSLTAHEDSISMVNGCQWSAHFIMPDLRKHLASFRQAVAWTKRGGDVPHSEIVRAKRNGTREAYSAVAFAVAGVAGRTVIA